MKHLLAILISLIIISSCKNDDDTIIPVSEDKLTFIWQGFYHDWTYNHRVNRMGDWIGDVDYSTGFKANFIHSAASGIGADELTFTTFTTAIRTSANVEFESGVVSAVLKAEEGSTNNVTIPVQVVIEDQQHEVASVILNGFDMYSRPIGSVDLVGDGQADKLFHFEVRFDNVSLNVSGTNSVIDFDIYIALGADCTSPECSSGPLNDWFDYQVSVAYQVISGNNTELSLTSGTIANSYSWERPMNAGSNEIQRDDYELDDQMISGIPGSDLGILGISSLLFQTEKGLGGFDGNVLQYPHMLNFDTAIRNSRYEAITGNMVFNSDLFFKNWTAPVPPVSFGGGGSVAFEMGLELVQITDDNALLESFEYPGSIVWLTNPFNPAPPTGPASLNLVPVDLELE